MSVMAEKPTGAEWAVFGVVTLWGVGIPVLLGASSLTPWAKASGILVDSASLAAALVWSSRWSEHPTWARLASGADRVVAIKACGVESSSAWCWWRP